MAGIKISALPTTASALLTDFFPVVQGGVTSQETLLQVATLFGFGSGILALSAGGTSANLTAANGAIPYSTASALALLAPGSSGQLFQSGGAGEPVWTTATYPATASTTGKVLVSDGTNFNSSFTTAITALGAQAQALNMGTHLINNVVDPVSAQDAATKNYVDQNALTGTSVYAASTGTLGTVTQSGAGVGATLTNAGAQATFALDSVNPPVGSNVLIKNTSTGATSANEGIYTVTNAGSGATNWILTRASDYDSPAEINRTGLIVVLNGTTLSGTTWYNTSTIATVDTTAFSYAQFGSYPVSLANGGTNASLTASNGGIFYSTASAGAILSGTSTANQLLLSGASTTPAWSTSTYPATNAVNTLLYASSANVMAALATSDSGVLVTSVSGVPSISSTLPAFTTSSITFSPTTGGIVGTTTNDNAAAGKVGEFITSNIPFGSAVSITNNMASDITSISLTAGDWNIYGNLFFNPSGADFTSVSLWASTTSATQPDLSLVTFISSTTPSIGNVGLNVPVLRVSISSPATVYLSTKSSFSMSATAAGTLSARRVR